MKQFTDAAFAALTTEQIEAIAKSVVTMIASGNTIKGSDGKDYQVTVVEQPKNVTDAPPTPEPSYKLEDIVDIVKPAYYLSDDDRVYKDESAYKSPSRFPKESQGKQVAALCQLFKLMQWANEGRERKKDESFYEPLYVLKELKLIYKTTPSIPIYFFDYEKGCKLIEANEQLFKDFFGV